MLFKHIKRQNAQYFIWYDQKLKNKMSEFQKKDIQQEIFFFEK